MNEKIVNVGVFWAIPDKVIGQSLLEVHKGYYTGEADINGFLNYPYSHFDVWEDEAQGLGDDCYKYPRGRVLYDVNLGKHKIFCDRHIDLQIIDEVIMLFDIDDYEICYDEHYVCAACRREKSSTKSKSNCVLKAEVLRGQDKIGENLIRVTYGDVKILVELGKQLERDENAAQRETEFENAILQEDFTAVVVSHYHEDHAGLISYKQNCPIYIGRGAYRVLKTSYEYLGKDFPKNLKTYSNNRPFKIGDITVTPFLCDHSAYDSYMLLFEAGGQSILYTGDFRFHGRKDKDLLLSALPKSVDVLIHEGTNIGNDACHITESQLEDRALEIMQATDGPIFVLSSASNVDRLVSIYRASKRSGRLTYMDNYMSLIASAAGGKIPRPDVFKDVIAFTPRPLDGRRKDMFFEINNKRGAKSIAAHTQRFTMFVRPSMLPYLKKLFALAQYSDATLIYSIWKGYKKDKEVSTFLDGVRSLGIKAQDLHTSGHASEEDIQLLKSIVSAKQYVCVHTQNNN